MSTDQDLTHTKNQLKNNDAMSIHTVETMDTTIADSLITASSEASYSRESMFDSLSQDSYKLLGLFQRSHAMEVRKILDIMTSAPYNIQIQLSSCKDLARLSYDEFYRVVIGSSGGILIIINTMKAHLNNPIVQAYGCVILGNMCIDSYGNKAQIGASSGISVIVAAMKSHPREPLVQSNAYFALEQLTLRTPLQREASNAKRTREVFKAATMNPREFYSPRFDWNAAA